MINIRNIRRSIAGWVEPSPSAAEEARVFEILEDLNKRDENYQRLLAAELDRSQARLAELECSKAKNLDFLGLTMPEFERLVELHPDFRTTATEELILDYKQSLGKFGLTDQQWAAFKSANDGVCDNPAFDLLVNQHRRDIANERVSVIAVEAGLTIDDSTINEFTDRYTDVTSWTDETLLLTLNHYLQSTDKEV